MFPQVLCLALSLNSSKVEPKALYLSKFSFFCSVQPNLFITTIGLICMSSRSGFVMHGIGFVVELGWGELSEGHDRDGEGMRVWRKAHPG